MKHDLWQPPRILVRLFIEELEKIRSRPLVEDIAHGIKSMFEDALKMAVENNGTVRYSASQVALALAEAFSNIVAPLTIILDPWVEEGGAWSKRRGPIYVEMVADILGVRHVITAGQELLENFTSLRTI